MGKLSFVQRHPHLKLCFMAASRILKTPNSFASLLFENSDQELENAGRRRSHEDVLEDDHRGQELEDHQQCMKDERDAPTL
jgi:hypothetical protein